MQKHKCSSPKMKWLVNNKIKLHDNFICFITCLYKLLFFILLNMSMCLVKIFLELIYYIFRILSKLVNRHSLLAEIKFKVFGLHSSRTTVQPYGRPIRIVIVFLTGLFTFLFISTLHFLWKTCQSLHVGRPKVFSKLSKVKQPSNLAFQEVSPLFN